MADQVLIVRDFDAAQPQRPAGGQPMGVVSDANSKAWRGSTPFSSHAAMHSPRKIERGDYTSSRKTPTTRPAGHRYRQARSQTYNRRVWQSSKSHSWQSPIGFIRRRKVCWPRCAGCSAANIALVAGRARHRPDGRVGRIRRLSRAQRRRQDHHAQAPLRRDPSHGRHGAGDGPRSLAARKRLSPPLRPGDGAEEPALVGPAGPGIVPPAPADLSHRAGHLRAAARRAGRSAHSRASCSASRCANCRWASG